MTDSSLWTELSATWQGTDTAGPRLDVLRQRVDRETRQLRWIVRMEVAVTLAVFGGLAASLGAVPRDQRWGWVAAALAHTAVVVGFTIWNRHGIWQPFGASTREYLRLAAERARRRLRSARFVAAVLSVEAVVMLAWLGWADRLGASMLLATGAAVLLVWWIAESYRRRWRADLARVLAVSDALALDDRS